MGWDVERSARLQGLVWPNRDWGGQRNWVRPTCKAGQRRLLLDGGGVRVLIPGNLQAQGERDRLARIWDPRSAARQSSDPCDRKYDARPATGTSTAVVDVLAAISRKRDRRAAHPRRNTRGALPSVRVGIPPAPEGSRRGQPQISVHSAAGSWAALSRWSSGRQGVEEAAGSLSNLIPIG
jgi:hypothetical protein